MQAVIEAIADAVSQLILFSVEAESNSARLPMLEKGGAGVKKAVGVLNGIGTKMSDGWAHDPQRQKDMQAVVAKLVKASDELANEGSSMARNGYSEKGKLAMMDAAKHLLGNTIEMLKIADDYDVGQICKASDYTTSEVELVKAAKNAADLNEAARGMSHRSLNLIKLAAERVSLLNDYNFKTRLDEATNTLRADHESFVASARETVVRKPGVSDTTQHQNVAFVNKTASRLQDAITEIILVSRLSAKHMWDKINLDVAAMRRGKLPPLDQLLDLRAHIDHQIDRLAAAVNNRDQGKRNEAMPELRSAVAEASPIASVLSDTCGDPLQRKAILSALRDLEAMPTSLERAADEAIRNPTPATKAAWDKALEDARRANADLVEAALPPDQNLLDALAALNAALERLRNAAKNAKGPEAEKEAQEAVKQLAKEIEAARKLQAKQDDPLQRQLIADAIDAASEAAAPLMNAVAHWKAKGCPRDGADNGDALKNLLDAVERLRRLAGDLKDAAITPDKEIADGAQQIADGLERLKDALHEPDRERAAMELPKVQRNIDAQVERVNAFAANVDDPTARQAFVDDAAELKQLNPQLADVAKKLMAQPHDPVLEALLQDLINRINDCNNRIVRNAADEMERRLNPEADLLAALARLRRALAGLRDATDRNDSQQAVEAVKQAASDMQKAPAFAKRLAAALPDQEKRLANRAGEDMTALVPVLVGGTKKVLQSPDDAAARRQHHADIAAVQALADKLPALLGLSVEAQLEKGAKELNELLDQYVAACGNGDGRKAAELGSAARAKMDEQADRAKQFGASLADDPVRKAQLFLDADRMLALKEPLVRDGKTVASNPSDAQAKKALANDVAEIKELNGRFLHAPPVSDRPVDQVLRALQETQLGVHAGNEPDTNTGLRHLQRDLPAFVAEAKRVGADKIKNPRLRSDLEDALQALQHKAKELEPVAGAATAAKARGEPDAPHKVARADELIDALRALARQVAEAELTPESQLERYAAELNELLDQYGDACKAGDAQRSRALGDQAARKMDEQAQRAKRFAAAADTPLRRAQLLADADKMLALREPLISDGTAVSVDPSDAVKRNRLDDDIADIKELNARFAHAPPAFELPADKALRALDEVQAGVHKPSVADTNTGMRHLRHDLPPALAAASLVAADLKKIPDPNARDDLLAAIEALKRQLALLANAAPPAAQAKMERAPDAVQKSKAADELIELMRQNLKKLADAELNASAEKAIVDTADAIDRHYGALYAKLRDADRNGALGELDALKREILKQAGLARDMANLSDDPMRQAEFRAIGDELEALLPRLADVTARLLANPNDKEAWKDLEAIQKELNALNMRLLEAIEQENSAKLERALEQLLERQARGEDCTDLLKEIDLLLKKQALIAKALAARTGDPKRRRDLLDAARELENALKNIMGAYNADDKPALGKAVNKVYDALQTLKVSAQDEIAAAAQAIAAAAARKKRTLAGYGEGSAAFRMLNGASDIARLMAELSAAAKRKDKKRVIELSRLIAAKSKEVATAAEEIGKECKDVRMRNELLRFVSPLTSSATQLKILTAVKANTSEDDPAYKQQLVTCAKGIAAACVGSCDAAEVCLLRSK